MLTILEHIERTMSPALLGDHHTSFGNMLQGISHFAKAWLVKAGVIKDIMAEF